MRGVRCLKYALAGGATEKTHYCSRTFENAVWHASAAHDALAASTPVLIVAAADEHSATAAAECQVLLNLSDECPPFFERHDRLLEVVAQGDSDRRAGRARYAFYRDRGYAIRNHDLAGEARA